MHMELNMLCRSLYFLCSMSWKLFDISTHTLKSFNQFAEETIHLEWGWFQLCVH